MTTYKEFFKPIWEWGIWNKKAIDEAPDIQAIKKTNNFVTGFTTASIVVGAVLLYYLLRKK